LLVGSISVFHDDVTINFVVEHNLVDGVFLHKTTFGIGENGNVRRCLGVLGGQGLQDNFFLLLRGEIFLLISSGHGSVLDIEHFIILLEVV
jgi:hypothetical protein